MQPKIIIQINDESREFDSKNSFNYPIKEVDELRISVYSDLEDEPEIFFDDYQARIEQFSDEKGVGFKTPLSRYFAECFGRAVVRIYLQNVTVVIVFDVHAKKSSSEQARKMIKYLAAQHEQLIKVCFSRSSLPVGTVKEDFSDPEMIIFTAEKFIETLENLRSELLATKRERLVPTRQPLWRTNRLSYEIDPLDILTNLDSIIPSPYESDLFLKGRHYKLDNIDVSTLKQTADVVENQILLGGLYSIQIKIQMVMDGLEHKDASTSPFNGYESFDRLLLTFTSTAMLNRCEEIQATTTELIRLFERKMGVKHRGELRPIMTPYARTSRVYRSLYRELNDWYELGRPTFDGIHFLIKLRSLSKIYELFTLFHIVETFTSSDWLINDAKPHPEFDGYVPSEVVLQKAGLQITLFYDMKIYPWSQDTLDGELIDVCHTGRGENSNWKPDFVLRLDSNNATTRYLILDAKYSTEYTVRNTHLPALVDKYYWGTSVYRKAQNYATNHPITSILAIYPLTSREKFIPYGIRTSNYEGIAFNRAGIDTQRICPIPILGGVGLSVDDSEKFNQTISTIVEKSLYLSVK